MNNIEYKILPFDIKSTESTKIDGKNIGIVRGYLATFSPDRGGDIIERGAFQKTIEDHKQRNNRPIRMYFQHDQNKVLGIFPIHLAYEDEKGLFVEGHINLDKQLGRDVYSDVKFGAISDFSIGYNLPKFEYIKDQYDRNKTWRLLKQIDLLEGSLVSEPMNIDAMVTNVKNYYSSKSVYKKTATQYQDLPLAERDYEWDSEAAEARVRRFTDSEDGPSETYKDAFMYHDIENEDNFGAYKLQYADVIDGELKAVPRAIFAIAAVLDGARGGVEISTDDAERVKNHVIRYYEKMDMEPPFDKSKEMDDEEEAKQNEEDEIKEGHEEVEKEEPSDYEDEDLTIVVTKSMLLDGEFTKRDLERVLRESKRFSSRACVTLASALDKLRVDSKPDYAKSESANDLLLKEIKGLTQLIENKW